MSLQTVRHPILCRSGSHNQTVKTTLISHSMNFKFHIPYTDNPKTTSLRAIFNLQHTIVLPPRSHLSSLLIVHRKSESSIVSLKPIVSNRSIQISFPFRDTLSLRIHFVDSPPSKTSSSTARPSPASPSHVNTPPTLANPCLHPKTKSAVSRVEFFFELLFWESFVSVETMALGDCVGTL